MEPQIPWWKDPKQLVTIIGAIFAGIATWQASCANQNTTRTADKVDYVVEKQQEQMNTAAVIKADLQQATAKTEQKLQAIESKATVIDAKLPK
jgi:predicted  nucleic acid-binding Zn-ribbon protein